LKDAQKMLHSCVIARAREYKNVSRTPIIWSRVLFGRCGRPKGALRITLALAA